MKKLPLILVKSSLSNEYVISGAGAGEVTNAAPEERAGRVAPGCASPRGQLSPLRRVTGSLQSGVLAAAPAGMLSSPRAQCSPGKKACVRVFKSFFFFSPRNRQTAACWAVIAVPATS